MLIGMSVAVIGGGIGGLATALALRLRGADVTVLEQAPSIREVGAGLQISPNGVAVLQALGVAQAVREAATEGRATLLRDGASGRKVATIAQNLRAHPYLFVHRADLQRILADAARDAGVKIRLLQHIDKVAPSDRGCRLTNSQGARHNAALAIGADGVHSVARAVLNGAQSPFFTGQVAWRATVKLTGGGAEPVSTVYMGPGRHLVTYPLRGGTLMNIVAVEERPAWTAESWSQTDDAANLRAAFSGFCGDVQALLARVERPGIWGLFRHDVAANWAGNGLALVGDAAHPTLPFLAQGANMALEDAWCLAACLGGYDTTAAALSAYEAARRPRTARIVAAANRNARRFHLSPLPLRLAAQSALTALGTFAPNRLSGGLNWLYDHDVTAEAL